VLEGLSMSDVQMEVLREKALKWADTIRPSFLQKYDVLPMLRSTIQKSLEYPMALTTLSATQWEKILSPVLMAALPKAGICRTFSRVVVFAPMSFQGVGVPHPYAIQMTKHLDMLLRHQANRTKTGKFLEANIQAHQLETGTAYGIFQQVYSNTAILASDIHVEFNSPPLLLQRQGDQLLTDMFMEALVDQSTLKWLNWCRTYLHAVTLSDIVTADGKHITLFAWTGIRGNHRLDWYHNNN